MQILHFDWLCYYRSISNSHRVAKFAGFVNLFISFYPQINIFVAEFSIASMLVFQQGYLSRKNLSYFSIYTAKENLSRKTC